jgi:ligand-binding sensor protein
MEDKIEALKTANDYIYNLKVGILDIVNKINTGNENIGISLIGQVSDGIEWLVSIILLTSDFHKGNISIGNINEKLQEIIEALENEDYVLVGDLFNYELLPVIESIENQIKKVI